MKITNKTLHVSIEHNVTLGHNDAIEATLVHQAFLSKNTDGSISVDLDFADITDVKFMGIPIGTKWDDYKKFKESMKQFGINVDELMDKKAASLITDKELDQIKALYKTTVK
jgi:hypothetical protein